MNHELIEASYRAMEELWQLIDKPKQRARADDLMRTIRITLRAYGETIEAMRKVDGAVYQARISVSRAKDEMTKGA